MSAIKIRDIPNDNNDFEEYNICLQNLNKKNI